MAAKPPKPPGNFLKNPIINCNTSNHSNSSDNNTTANSSVCVNAANENNIATSPTPTTTTKKANCNCTNITIMHLFHEMKQEFPTIPDTIVTQCVNENCHQRENCIQMLRNELELNPIPVQSYPAKVLHPPNNNNNNSNNNHNHNSSNHHHYQQQHSGTPPPPATKPPLQQKPTVQQRTPLKPPLKPVRPAPLQPNNGTPAPTPAALGSANANNKSNSPLLQRKITSGLVNNGSTIRRHLNKTLSGDATSTASAAVAESEGVDINEMKLNDMPAKTNHTTIQKPPQEQQSNGSRNNSPQHEVNNNNTHNNSESQPTSGIGEINNVAAPRVRPTTLNLNTTQQQQQRQRLNVQLQEHFLQQRNKQQTQNPTQLLSQQQQQTTTTTTSNVKPLRKAPLPPIAPKPILFQQHSTTNNNNHNHNSHNNNSNAGGGGDSHSLSSHSTSPLGSESEISLNASLSTLPSPTSAASTTTSKTHHTQHLQNKSPMRHRSVITLQPEPPYTRDFFQTITTSSNSNSNTIFSSTNSLSSPGGTPSTLTPTTANSSVVSSPTNSGYSGSSQKSYTSVNLTLRPPTTVPNSALQPSAIDITAGPGFSGASGGGKSLSYSSTSYDARLGYQQNFHITVTDEGGVFSASRRRPQRNANQVNICENQYDGNNSDGDKYNNHVNSLYAEQQQHINQTQQQQQYLQQQQQQQQQQLEQQFHNNHNPTKQIKTPPGIGSGDFGNMCLAPQQAEDEFVAEILERQKKRRDKLAAALRENKKRLGQVEHEVNLITGPIPMGLTERLDIEIQKLRAECQAMLRSSNPLANQYGTPQQVPQQQQQQQQQQFPPQPFPRQRSSRPPPRPPPPRQTSLDIIQHHATPTTPHTPASLPNFSNAPSPTVAAGHYQLQQQQQLQHSHSLSPSIYQQQQQQHSPLSYQPHHNNHNHNPALVTTSSVSTALPPNDDTNSYYSDTENGDFDDEDDDEYELVEPWECSMCTFRNHPQLNICECCENVRILPGTLTNLSRAISSNSAASSSSASLGTTAAGGGGGGLTSVANRSVTDINAAGVASGVNSLNVASAANANLEHDTNLAQQQLQHFALHT